MKHTTSINKRAWIIRRDAANRLQCAIMDVSWKDCLILAKTNDNNYLDTVTKRYTASTSFVDLLSVNDNYNPTLFTKRYPALIPLANAFDACMSALGRPNRIYRPEENNVALGTRKLINRYFKEKRK